MIFFLACATAAPPPPSCPDGMALISAGPVTLGVEERTKAWHRPAHTVTLSAYCIDRYEYPNQAGQLPKNHVTFNEASALCSEAEKRLCSSDEWERACRGTAGTTYSYGNDYDPTRCNTPLAHAGAPRSQDPLAPAGHYSDCVSPEGVYDLNGSLSEWVDTPWNEPGPPGVVVDPARWRVLRGGTMWAKTAYGQDCLSRHAHDRSTYRNDDDGFRCCRAPSAP